MSTDWHAADDLVQETLTKVYLRWGRLDPRAADAYARRVLVTVFLDSRRRPWRREHAVEELPDVPESPGKDLSIGTGDLGREELLAALREVPERQRAVLVLRYFDDCSLDQTAALLGCSVGNVKSQASRGLTRLREVLGVTRTTSTPSTIPPAKEQP